MWCLRASAVCWGCWMMDARRESYVTAPSALTAPGGHTPAPNADLLLRMTQRFYTLSFALSAHSLSLTHNGDSWIYSTISSLALCCAEQSTLQQAGPLYRVLHQPEMSWQTGHWMGDWLGGAGEFNYCTQSYRGGTGVLSVLGNGKCTCMRTNKKRNTLSP